MITFTWVQMFFLGQLFVYIASVMPSVDSTILSLLLLFVRANMLKLSFMIVDLCVLVEINQASPCPMMTVDITEEQPGFRDILQSFVDLFRLISYSFLFDRYRDETDREKGYVILTAINLSENISAAIPRSYGVVDVLFGFSIPSVATVEGSIFRLSSCLVDLL